MAGEGTGQPTEAAELAQLAAQAADLLLERAQAQDMREHRLERRMSTGFVR
jgi:hypothetical protein